MNYFKRLETILIAVIILVLGVAYGVLSSKVDAPNTSNDSLQPVVSQQATSQQQVPDSSSVRYSGQEGRTALDLLKANYRVETQSFGDMGEFVKAIDGVEPDSTHFWSFYLNGSQSQVGAGTYFTKSTDIIEWRLEKIQ
jgi:hypothetical protein